MKLRDLLREASYPGNLGMMEMFKFYELANPTEKQKMKELISAKKFKEAWELLKSVVGVKLANLA